MKKWQWLESHLGPYEQYHDDVDMGQLKGSVSNLSQSHKSHVV
jgi:hypothetical protein